MSLWYCPTCDDFRGPSPSNQCQSCGSSMQWATVELATAVPAVATPHETGKADPSRIEELLASLSDQDEALTNAGIVDDHGTLRWVFTPDMLEVSSSGGTHRTRLTMLLTQTAFLINDMQRKREAQDEALTALKASVEQWKVNSRENKLIAEENSRRADRAEAQLHAKDEALRRVRELAGCIIEPASSRMCELGSKCCNVRHSRVTQ